MHQRYGRTMRFDVEALLFDIDGTLVDSTPVVERTWSIWAARHGVDVNAILAVCHGRRTEDTVAEFLPEAECAAATAELTQLELDDLDGVVALPAVRDLLMQLPPDRWAAVTSGSQELMRARLRAAGLPIPSVLIAAENVTHGKPDPEGYVKAAVALGRAPSRCLVIEDAPAGLAAGLASGAKVLAVATSQSPDALGSAHAVIPDLTYCTIAVSDMGIRVETLAREEHPESRASSGTPGVRRQS